VDGCPLHIGVTGLTTYSMVSLIDGLAYVSRHRGRIQQAILAGVRTGRHVETERLFEGMADEHPTEWEPLLEGIPTGLRGSGVFYEQPLFDPDSEVVAEAAHRSNRFE
jgi:hypothetical protein